ncbi:hypothetical protein [Nocardia sp. NPDC006630]|uniref:hypothetical protein n=1 Tax=Nocardia sp. NPDC006630 TaxID=3157181 RepID=UPI0033B92024
MDATSDYNLAIHEMNTPRAVGAMLRERVEMASRCATLNAGLPTGWSYRETLEIWPAADSELFGFVHRRWRTRGPERNDELGQLATSLANIAVSILLHPEWPLLIRRSCAYAGIRVGAGLDGWMLRMQSREAITIALEPQRLPGFRLDTIDAAPVTDTEDLLRTMITAAYVATPRRMAHAAAPVSPRLAVR